MTQNVNIHYLDELDALFHDIDDGKLDKVHTFTKVKDTYQGITNGNNS